MCKPLEQVSEESWSARSAGRSQVDANKVAGTEAEEEKVCLAREEAKAKDNKEDKKTDARRSGKRKGKVLI